eukprot:CAMPEP_0115730808 /NCGR_PEP_ID=MMETSP0272-20121206/84236_1 /TAXON_ID=71861 /ORGANISM="Scrippsiella trochoidea, Strain CCMP3099" /LENGTH=67 /DNA_ID=CAMNT_0003174577 /DNA_START=9 /DNA_END=209 /DNA_ORIENTATION=+
MALAGAAARPAAGREPARRIERKPTTAPAHTPAVRLVAEEGFRAAEEVHQGGEPPPRQALALEALAL